MWLLPGERCPVNRTPVAGGQHAYRYPRSDLRGRRSGARYRRHRRLEVRRRSGTPPFHEASSAFRFVPLSVHKIASGGRLKPGRTPGCSQEGRRSRAGLGRRRCTPSAQRPAGFHNALATHGRQDRRRSLRDRGCASLMIGTASKPRRRKARGFFAPAACTAKDDGPAGQADRSAFATSEH